MKPIEQNEIEELLEIINPAPMIRIGHFADSGDILPEVLSKFCAAHEYEYILNCTDDSYYHTMQKRYASIPYCSIKSFSLAKASYMQHGKFYDHMFVTSCIPENERELFLRKAHKVIKNAGLILIFIENNYKSDMAQWNNLLEDNYFVATSSIKIDNIWSVIISKKMHGWGG